MNPITQKYLDSALIASFFAALAVSALSASSTPNGLSQSSGAKSHADIQNAGRGTDRGTQSKQHLQSGLADSVWPKSRGDLGNTGRSTGKGAVGTLRWKDKIRFGSDAVIGANGLVYVGSDNNTIFVADGATGAIVSRLSPVLGLPPPFDGFSTPAPRQRRHRLRRLISHILCVRRADRRSEVAVSRRLCSIYGPDNRDGRNSLCRGVRSRGLCFRWEDRQKEVGLPDFGPCQSNTRTWH